MTEAMVSFRGVDIVFGRRPQLALPMMDAGSSREVIQAETGQVLGVHDCTLDVAEGEIVVLMGLSGSGKSTLLRAVNGLNSIVRGSVRVHDGSAPVEVSRADAATLCLLRTTRIAMVFQQFALLPWRSVLENVGFGLELAGVPTAERRRRAMAQLELVHLEAWADRRVHELSGGMQQRVGLARAFATDAPILLMDEPFSALDPLIRNRLQDELLEFQSSLRRTIIFVSHDLDEALKIGSKIAIMEGGRIVQFGTPQDIVLHPASAYVADFVAHMNPLNVLRALEVMRPVARRPAPAPAAAQVLAPDTDIAADRPVVAGPDCSVRDLMRAYLRTELPIAVTQDDIVTGEVGGEEIIRALLRSKDVGP